MLHREVLRTREPGQDALPKDGEACRDLRSRGGPLCSASDGTNVHSCHTRGRQSIMVMVVAVMIARSKIKKMKLLVMVMLTKITPAATTKMMM